MLCQILWQPKPEVFACWNFTHPSLTKESRQVTRTISKIDMGFIVPVPVPVTAAVGGCCAGCCGGAGPFAAAQPFAPLAMCAQALPQHPIVIPGTRRLHQLRPRGPPNVLDQGWLGIGRIIGCCNGSSSSTWIPACLLHCLQTSFLFPI